MTKGAQPQRCSSAGCIAGEPGQRARGFSAQLAHSLNQPSFTTIQAENSETTDPSMVVFLWLWETYANPLIKTFLFDYVHRRESTSEVIEAEHDKILECHENFTR